MFCVFHPTNAATAQCVGCNRPLCAACDHRIKAQPYCEDCIVRGVDVLRRPSGPVVAPQMAIYPPPMPMINGPSPIKATLLAFIPGLGSVYNRQNLKALFHFIGTVGLIQLADATDMEFFGIGAFVFFLYTVIDANRSARSISAGANPSDDENRLRWLFARYMPLWGLILIASALVVALSSIPMLPGILTPARIWGVILFIAGAYMIFAYTRSLRSDEPRSFATPPRSVVSSILPGEVEGLTNYQNERTTSHLHER
jgi:hypothetical protein